jgi:lambda repressor-like predicted transcriptional regulator
MTDARRKAKIAMLQKGVTFQDLTTSTGLSKASIHNLLSNASESRKSRQAITNALGIQLWDEIEVTEGSITLPAGMLVRWPSDIEAAEFLKEFAPAVVEVRKNLVEITRDLSLRISFRDAATSTGRRRPTGIIKIWGPEDRQQALTEQTKNGRRRKRPSNASPPGIHDGRAHVRPGDQQDARQP